MWQQITKAIGQIQAGGVGVKMSEQARKARTTTRAQILQLPLHTETQRRGRCDTHTKGGLEEEVEVMEVEEKEEVGGSRNITGSFFFFGPVVFWEVWQLLIQNICSR